MTRHYCCHLLLPRFDIAEWRNVFVSVVIEVCTILGLIPVHRRMPLMYLLYTSYYGSAVGIAELSGKSALCRNARKSDLNFTRAGLLTYNIWPLL